MQDSQGRQVWIMKMKYRISRACAALLCVFFLMNGMVLKAVATNQGEPDIPAQEATLDNNASETAVTDGSEALLEDGETELPLEELAEPTTEPEATEPTEPLGPTEPTDNEDDTTETAADEDKETTEPGQEEPQPDDGEQSDDSEKTDTETPESASDILALRTPASLEITIDPYELMGKG